jgi:hypothetical protein
MRREVRRGRSRENRNEEVDPTGHAPADFFFTGAVGH